MNRQEISSSKSTMAGSNGDKGREIELDDHRHQHHQHHVAERIVKTILKYAQFYKLDVDATKIHLDSEEPIHLVDSCLNAMNTKYVDQKEKFQEHMMHTHNLEQHNIALQKKVEELTAKAEYLREGLYASVKTKKDMEHAAETREQILKCKLEELANENDTNNIQFAKEQNEKNDLIKTLHRYIELNENELDTDYKVKMAERIKFYETYISRIYQKFMILVPNPAAKQQLVLKPLHLDDIEQCLSKDWDIVLMEVNQIKNNCDKAVTDMRTLLLEKEELAQTLEQEKLKFNDVTQRLDILNGQLQMDRSSVLKVIEKLSINEQPVQILDDISKTIKPNENVQSNSMAMALEQLHLKADTFLKYYKKIEKKMEIQEKHVFWLEEKLKKRIETEYIVEQQNQKKSVLVKELQIKVKENQDQLEECLGKLQCQELEGETLKREHTNLQLEFEELKTKHALRNKECKKLQDAQQLSLKRVILAKKHNRRQELYSDEREKVRLTHEIGGLNQEIEELKKLNREQQKALSELQAQQRSSNDGAAQIFAR